MRARTIRPARPLVATMALMVISVVSGCSISPDTGLTFMPHKHRLLPAADEIRKNVPNPAPVPRELTKSPLPVYIVEPGDVLQFEHAKADTFLEFPANQPVLPDGTIDLGKYGRLPVAGRTIEEIEASILEAMKTKSKEPVEVEVRLVEWPSKVYYVDGEVRSPGAYQVDGWETVQDAIHSAGGLNNRASHLDIILSRPTGPDGCRIVLPICWDDIVQLGDTTTDYQIQPGDSIFVSTRSMRDRFARRCKKLLCNKSQIGCLYGDAPCGAGCMPGEHPVAPAAMMEPGPMPHVEPTPTGTAAPVKD